MNRRFGQAIAGGRGAVVRRPALAPAAQAEDFLSALFGAFGAGRPRCLRRCRCLLRAKARSNAPASSAARRASVYGGGQAYCVRTCDGRYFPIAGADNESRAAVLQQLLPGERDQGGLWQQYRQCRHRDRKTLFRTAERVPLSQRDRGGMHLQRQGPVRPGARSRSRTTRRLRKGDLVAGANGLMVAGRSADQRGASLNFSPRLESVRARYQRVPVVASE